MKEKIIPKKITKRQMLYRGGNPLIYKKKFKTIETVDAQLDEICKNYKKRR